MSVEIGFIDNITWIEGELPPDKFAYHLINLTENERYQISLNEIAEQYIEYSQADDTGENDRLVAARFVAACYDYWERRELIPGDAVPITFNY